MTDVIDVLDGEMLISFCVDDLMRYHGPEAPGGVAHAVKVLQRALPLLSPDGPVQRREVEVSTAHPGPGVRDTFEMVLRAVTGDRYTVDPELERGDRGPTLQWFVFRLSYRDATVTLQVREGFVPPELIVLARQSRTTTEEARFAVLKREMAQRVLASSAADVYDVCV